MWRKERDGVPKTDQIRNEIEEKQKMDKRDRDDTKT